MTPEQAVKDWPIEDGDVTMKVTDFHRLFSDATRWRAFENSTHLMIVDFDQRISGVMKATKRTAVDACIKTDEPDCGALR